MKLSLLAAAASCVCAGAAHAHYHMLLPDKNSVKTGEEVTITYQFGHPFEHQLFHTAPPAIAEIYRPDGTVQDVKTNVKKIEVAGENDKKVTVYQLTFKPEQRGDHIVVFTSPEVAIDGEKLPIVDTAKVVVHVQTQNGWESPSAHHTNQAVDLTPLTRPYGLRTGMVFRAAFNDVRGFRRGQNVDIPKPIRNAAGEIEHYNPQPPKQLPPDEHTTYAARTDDIGVLASTLPDPGWWGVTAIRPTEKRVDRCTFWVYVDDKIPLKPAE